MVAVVKCRSVCGRGEMQECVGVVKCRSVGVGVGDVRCGDNIEQRV